jgi:Undecaprenyl-phosphate galactose phosphotransferase WbaP
MGQRETFNWIKAQTETLIIFVMDVLFILGIFKFAKTVRTDILPFVYSGFPAEEPFRSGTYIFLVVLIWVFFLYYEGLYTRRYSYWDEIRALWRVSVFSTIAIFTITSIVNIGDEISRTVILLMGIVAIVLLPLFRMTFKRVLRRIGFLKRRVLILGAGETGLLIFRALRREPNYGYDVVGFVDDDPGKCGKLIEGVKIHRGVDKTEKYINKANITDLFIAMPGAGKERLELLINRLQHKVGNILFIPDVFGIAVLGTSLQHFFHEGAFAFEMKNNLSEPFNIFLKKVFDMLVSILLLPFLFIIMGVLILLIRLDSRGAALYSQERIGKNGKKFNCFKFRTMYADAEEKLDNILKMNPEAREEWENSWKLKNDPRITRVGRFLRSTSFDELPQILNVLKGDMSLVGPRPVTRDEIDLHYKDSSRLIFSVLPGITGLWQVSGRSNTSYKYRIFIDSWYVKNWNFWLDIVILFKTVRVVIKREGAW